MTRGGRRWVVALVLVALLAGGIWGLLAAASPQFVAGALGAFLGRRVEVERVEIRARASLEVELRNLRVFDEGLDDATATVDRILARLAWPRLLAGQLVPTSWTLEHPVIRLREGAADGSLKLPILPVNVTVREGTLVWDESVHDLRVSSVHLSAQARPITGAVHGTVMGRLEGSGRTLGSFSLELEGGFDGGRARGSVTGLDLAALPIDGLHPLQGLASGTVDLRWTPEASQSSLDLEVEGFVLNHPSLLEPIAPREAHVSADVAISPEAIKVRLWPLTAEGFTVRGTIEVGRGAKARVQADLSVDPFRVGVRDGRLQLMRILAKRFATWARADERAEDGRVERVFFRLDVPRPLLMDTLAFRRKTRPRELRISAQLRDGVYRHRPENAPLEGIEAIVEIRGNRLEVYDLRMHRQGQPLPELDITIDGLHRFVRLPLEERRVPKGPGSPIPGLGPAFAALAEGQPSEREEALVRVTGLTLGYPSFLLQIRDAEATVSFPDGNVLVEELDGAVGGVRARGRAFWNRTKNLVLVDLAYGDEEPRGARRPESPWVEATFTMETAHVGLWRLEDVVGKFSGVGSEIRLSGLTAELADGSLEAAGTLDLSHEGKAPLAMSFELREAAASEVGATLGLQQGTLAGTLATAGRMEGPLQPGLPFVVGGRIDLDVEVREGKVGNLPITVTLARLANPLGWTGLFGRPLPVETLDTKLQIERGTLQVVDFNLVGPELRILSAGRIELDDAERPVDLLVALLLFQPVDRVISTVPVLGDWILGDDRSLVALYFKLSGPWEEPDGSYVPPRTLRAATGWAESIIVGGVRRLRDLLLPSGSRGTP